MKVGGRRKLIIPPSIGDRAHRRRATPPTPPSSSTSNSSAFNNQRRPLWRPLMKLYFLISVLIISPLFAEDAPQPQDAADTSQAGTPPVFQSASAINAQARYNAAMTKADAAYRQAASDAAKKYAAELGVSMKMETKAGNLEEALKIDQEKKRVESQITTPIAPPRSIADVKEQIIRQRFFEYEWKGNDNRKMELLSNGKIGIGAGK